MEKDIELTSYLLCYLQESGHFRSKQEMAEAFDMTKRVLQRLMNTPDQLKGGSVALGRVLCYFSKHNIPLEEILKEYLAAEPEHGEWEFSKEPVEAYRRLSFPPLRPLTKEGEMAIEYCREFLCLISQYICSSCVRWCDPWQNGQRFFEQDCLMGRVAQRVIKAIETNYA